MHLKRKGRLDREGREGRLYLFYREGLEGRLGLDYLLDLRRLVDL
jgi:hypothetical protein